MVSMHRYLLEFLEDPKIQSGDGDLLGELVEGRWILHIQ